MDRAPYPADWALSRIVVSPEDTESRVWAEGHWRSRTIYREQLLHYEITRANAEVWCSMEGFADVPQAYLSVFHRTKAFTTVVQDLAAAALKHEPLKWAEAACFIIDYSVVVIKSEQIGLKHFLHSQRESIYWILDDALLRLCLDRWDAYQVRPLWDKAIEPITLALSNAINKVPEWVQRDVEALTRFGIPLDTVRSAKIFADIYFERTRRFLRESTRIYEVWRTVRLSGIGQLPVELANVIIDDVLSFEKLTTGDLRSSYLSKGKGKA
jgi:hypothetical protein